MKIVTTIKISQVMSYANQNVKFDIAFLGHFSSLKTFVMHIAYYLVWTVVFQNTKNLGLRLWKIEKGFLFEMMQKRRDKPRKLMLEGDYKVFFLTPEKCCYKTILSIITTILRSA